MVLPKSAQKKTPRFTLSIVAIGTSTCGERTPPSGCRSASRASTTGEGEITSSGGPTGGATPVRTQVSRPLKAAWRIQCCGPALTGFVHPKGLYGVRRYSNI